MDNLVILLIAMISLGVSFGIIDLITQAVLRYVDAHDVDEISEEIR